MHLKQLSLKHRDFLKFGSPTIQDKLNEIISASSWTKSGAKTAFDWISVSLMFDFTLNQLAQGALKLAREGGSNLQEELDSIAKQKDKPLYAREATFRERKAATSTLTGILISDLKKLEAESMALKLLLCLVLDDAHYEFGTLKSIHTDSVTKQGDIEKANKGKKGNCSVEIVDIEDLSKKKVSGCKTCVNETSCTKGI